MLKNIETETQIFNKLAENLKQLEKQKQDLSKEEFNKLKEIAINNANKEYRKIQIKTPCKKTHK